MIDMGYVWIVSCDDYRWDLKMRLGDVTRTYEVKTDTLLTPMKDTGNIAIEFESWDKLSGISVTEAQYYVYFMPFLGQIWTISTSDLKKLIKNNKLPVFKGGDPGSNTKLYGVKREKFKSHFKIHNIAPFVYIGKD